MSFSGGKVFVDFNFCITYILFYILERVLKLFQFV